MRALVTGASGFAGLHLLKHLAESGDSICAGYFPAKGEFACEWHELNVCQPESCDSVIKAAKPDVIFHLAGMAFGPDAEKDFNQALQVNVAGTFNIYRAAAAAGRPVKIILISSGEVYGRVAQESMPITEETSVSPANSYALSKLMAEQVALRFAVGADIETVILRPFNHFGPGQRSDFVISSFARQLALVAKGRQDAVLQVGNLEVRRDFSRVEDVVRAYRLAALNGKGVYNTCAGESVSIQSILDTLIEVSGVKVEVRRDPARMRASEVPLVSASWAKAGRELGWSPSAGGMREALAAVYQYWLAAV